jgi:hypothetical protein
MTKEKIGVADKIGGIEPLLGSASSGRAWRARRSFQLFVVTHGLSWGSQALNGEVAFHDFLIVVDR